MTGAGRDPPQPPQPAAVAVERGLDVGDRLLGVPEPHGAHPERGRGLAVDPQVVDEHRRLGLHAEREERRLVDARVGLAHAELGGVNDDVEQLGDGDHRLPARRPLADVVGADRHRVAAAAERAHERQEPLVRCEPGEQDLAEALQRDLVAARPGELLAELRQEVRLAQPPGLEREQRVLAADRAGRRHRGPKLLERDRGMLGEPLKTLRHRRCEHAAEIADHRPHARHSRKPVAQNVAST
jgi:hypothetical protein